MVERRVSVWILGDQLLRAHPAIQEAEAIYGKEGVKVVLVESLRRTLRLPYHRKKQVLLFSAMRHYAQGLQEKGYSAETIQAETFSEGLRRHVEKWRPETLYTMAASAYGGRKFQMERLSETLGIPVNVLPNTQFLVGRFDPIPEPEPGKRYVMEYFYRDMRRHYDLLIGPNGEPEGGQWNYDKENRKPLPKDSKPHGPPSFEPDSITIQVMEEIEERGHGVGSVGGFDLAATHSQAQVAFEDFLEHRLEKFGPYEDAMSSKFSFLYHSLLSPYLNIGLLDPLDLARKADTAYTNGKSPINSVEGFIRQIIGWREYIYWQYWRSMPDLAEVNFWKATRPIPRMYWDGETAMNCLKYVFQRASEIGYVHHIERLMLISNFSLLAGLDPLAINDWFLSFFIDAYEWVMLPNVLGMGLNADGGQIATKPYIASANYINRMSDYCEGCSFDHTKRTGPEACPFNTLYWNFLLEHEEILRSNPRMGRYVLGLRYLDEDERREVQLQAARLLDDLNLP